MNEYKYQDQSQRVHWMNCQNIAPVKDGTWNIRHLYKIENFAIKLEFFISQMILKILWALVIKWSI